MKSIACILTLTYLLSGSVGSLKAQEAPAGASAGEAADAAQKDANNPLAAKKALNLQNYNMPLHFARPGLVTNQLLIRYAQPLGKILLRGTMPFVMSAGRLRPPVNGLGDFNVMGLYTFELGGNQFGLGPNVTFPTGTNRLGAGKWQVGPSLLAFFAKSHVIQTGGLLQWQTSVAGNERRPGVNLITAQMFAILQAGKGTYFRSTGIWSFFLNNGNYCIPLGFGIGKVIKSRSVIFNAFIEPQFSVLAEGAGQPLFQTFIGFNGQF